MESIVKQVPMMEIARTYLALSKEFQESQLYRKAEDTLLVALEKLPNHPFLLSRLVNLYVKLDMPGKAMDVANKLIKHNSDLSFPYFMRGRIHEGNGNLTRAIYDYHSALRKSPKDIYILNRLIPLLMGFQDISLVLKIIEKYQELTNEPYLFAEYEAEALLQTGNNPGAFNKMRDAIMHDPGNKTLVKAYLRLSNESGKKKPSEVYQILLLSVPGVAELNENDHYEIDIDFLIQRENFSEALLEVSKILEKHPEDYYWRKRSAFLQLQMGLLEESAEQFRLLFLQDSTDVEVRNVLENYFIVHDRLDTWRQLVQQVLQTHENPIVLFNYLRSIGKKKNWLAICEFGFQEFIDHVENLNLAHSDIEDLTCEKLPAYAFEIFISQVAIHNKIPNPSDLWNLIYNERKKKNQIPPFHQEDLEAAYPVWIFALHIYFLFESFCDYPVSFEPRKFQEDHIVVTVTIEDKPVHVNISQLIGRGSSRLKQVAKGQDGLQWRWQKAALPPELMLHEISFYSARQAERIIKEMNANVGNILQEEEVENI